MLSGSLWTLELLYATAVVHFLCHLQGWGTVAEQGVIKAARGHKPRWPVVLQVPVAETETKSRPRNPLSHLTFPNKRITKQPQRGSVQSHTLLPANNSVSFESCPYVLI